jgi:hypothetical protein
MATKNLNVFTVIEREGQDRNFWQQVGAAFVNKDGSLNVRLNAIPLDGRLHIREQNGNSGTWTTEAKRLDVFTITEREGQDKAFWNKVGAAFPNSDGSLNVVLNCNPVDGRLHIREPRANGDAQPEGESKPKPKTKRRAKGKKEDK